MQGGLKIFLVSLFVILSVGGVGGVSGAAPTLTSVSGDPNPAFEYETVIVSSVAGIDENGVIMNNTSSIENAGVAAPGAANYECHKFTPAASERLSIIEYLFPTTEPCTDINIAVLQDGGTGGDIRTLLTPWQTADTNGEVIDFYGGDWNICKTDFYGEDLTLYDDTNYWMCMTTIDSAGVLSPLNCELAFLPSGYIEYRGAINGAESYLTDLGFLQDNVGLCGADNPLIGIYLRIWSVDETAENMALQCGLQSGGDYDLCSSSPPAINNPHCVMSNPVNLGQTKTVYCTAYNVESSAESSEQSYAQSTSATGITLPVSDVAKVGIYLQAREEPDLPIYIKAELHNAMMHNWQSFSASANGFYKGQINVDGTRVNTCNYDWDCVLDLNIGTHNYSLYSSIGSFVYEGQFNIDLNTEIVRIYIPMSYNIFDIYDDSEDKFLSDCEGIYSMTADGEVDNQRRIGTGLYIDETYSYWDSGTIIPRNCYSYSAYNIHQLYTFALPAWTVIQEPLVFIYGGEDGIDDNFFATHFFNGDITGGRSRQSQTNFYSLREVDYTGKVEQQEASSDDGIYSPIVTILTPNMNYNSAFFGDANYLTDSFGQYDNVACEAALRSHGHIIYDVNILLIKDHNEIVSEYSFSPYKTFHGDMEEHQQSGAYSYVWHIFENVDEVNSDLTCAIQTTNEIGYRSGWAFSPKRYMYGSNFSGDINIYVLDEDGSALGAGVFEAPSDGADNNIDAYNFKYAFQCQCNPAENPHAAYEGETILQIREIGETLVMSKIIQVDRGDSFRINMYVKDDDVGTDDEAAAFVRTTLTEQFGGRVRCRSEFYDRDLDWNSATLNFWTSETGSVTEPTCTRTMTYAYTTNCNPKYSPCMVHGATAELQNECGSDNNCYVEHVFSKRGCTALAAGTVTGYCSVTLVDSAGHSATAHASTTLEVQQYSIFALCSTYAEVDGERSRVVYTERETGWLECEVGLDNVLESDSNFTITFRDKTIPFATTKYDDYLGRYTHVFRADVTNELDAVARELSEDGQAWEGDIGVFVSHDVYGEFETTTHAAVFITGRRVDVEMDYTEEDVEALYDWITGLAYGLMSRPIETVQANFFTFLLLFLCIVIFAPIMIAFALVQARQRADR